MCICACCVSTVRAERKGAENFDVLAKCSCDVCCGEVELITVFHSAPGTDQTLNGGVETPCTVKLFIP